MLLYPSCKYKRRRTGIRHRRGWAGVLKRSRTLNEILMATCGPLGQIVIVKGPLAIGNYRMPRMGTLKAKPEEDGWQSAPWGAWGFPARAQLPCQKPDQNWGRSTGCTLGLIMGMRRNSWPSLLLFLSLWNLTRVIQDVRVERHPPMAYSVVTAAGTAALRRCGRAAGLGETRKSGRRGKLPGGQRQGRWATKQREVAQTQDPAGSATKQTRLCQAACRFLVSTYF